MSNHSENENSKKRNARIKREVRINEGMKLLAEGYGVARFTRYFEENYNLPQNEINKIYEEAQKEIDSLATTDRAVWRKKMLNRIENKIDEINARMKQLDTMDTSGTDAWRRLVETEIKLLDRLAKITGTDVPLDATARNEIEVESLLELKRIKKSAGEDMIQAGVLKDLRENLKRVVGKN